MGKAKLSAGVKLPVRRSSDMHEMSFHKPLPFQGIVHDAITHKIISKTIYQQINFVYFLIKRFSFILQQ